MALDLTATVRVGAIQFVDDFGSYQSSEGGAALTAEAVGTAARGIGQIWRAETTPWLVDSTRRRCSRSRGKTCRGLML